MVIVCRDEPRKKKKRERSREIFSTYVSLQPCFYLISSFLVTDVAREIGHRLILGCNDPFKEDGLTDGAKAGLRLLRNNGATDPQLSDMRMRAPIYPLTAPHDHPFICIHHSFSVHAAFQKAVQVATFPSVPNSMHRNPVAVTPSKAVHQCDELESASGSDSKQTKIEELLLVVVRQWCPEGSGVKYSTDELKTIWQGAVITPACISLYNSSHLLQTKSYSIRTTSITSPS